MSPCAPKAAIMETRRARLRLRRPAYKFRPLAPDKLEASVQNKLLPIDTPSGRHDGRMRVLFVHCDEEITSQRAWFVGKPTIQSPREHMAESDSFLFIIERVQGTECIDEFIFGTNEPTESMHEYVPSMG